MLPQRDEEGPGLGVASQGDPRATFGQPCGIHCQRLPRRTVPAHFTLYGSAGARLNARDGAQREVFP